MIARTVLEDVFTNAMHGNDDAYVMRDGSPRVDAALLSERLRHVFH
jgi:hypothetical protein